MCVLSSRKGEDENCTNNRGGGTENKMKVNVFSCINNLELEDYNVCSSQNFDKLLQTVENLFDFFPY